MKLKTVNVDKLKIVANPCNIHKDLFEFLDYIKWRDVKRAHRTNQIPKATALRLAKMMSDPDAVEAVKMDGCSPWLDFVDGLALALGFVDYDTKGEYMGYSSMSASFPDNYIDVDMKKYETFLACSPAKQERLILDVLIKPSGGSSSEFFSRGLFGSLTTFESWGCGTGVVPTLNFPKVRKKLLDLLARCESGRWLSVASLIEHMEKTDPYFLIPKKFKTRYKNEDKKRYDNFREYKGGSRYSGKEIPITEKSRDAFKRVEGRYIERFLEGAPLTMGHVDVAYKKKTEESLKPSIGHIAAFRINERFLEMMKDELPEPRVTVQPNFEIYVESPIYPAKIMYELLYLADEIQVDRVSILKLNKKMVAQAVARDDALDVKSLLEDLSGRALPRNVASELTEWARHSDMFTLYHGFSLLEGPKGLSIPNKFVKKNIAGGVTIVRSPEELFSRLEEDEKTPMMVKHSSKSFRPLPREAKTAFPKKSSPSARKKKKKKSVTLKRKSFITLYFPSKEIFELFLKHLLDARCPAEAEKSGLAITISDHHAPLVKTVIKALKKEYVIKIEDLG